jgi:beta-glucanase (GH16 family)
VYEPKNGKGALKYGQVWSSPLMIGYKTRYGITAFEWNNPRHQQFIQNFLVHSWHGDAYFQAKPYNDFSIKSYSQNPFSIYFY